MELKNKYPVHFSSCKKRKKKGMKKYVLEGSMEVWR
jgi:hypothetical protein